jgi:hypothetical protein
MDNKLYIKYIYVLLVAAYLSDQINQFYNFNIYNFNNLIGSETQNLVESVTELGLSFFSSYILFNFNIQFILLRFFLILFSVFYFIDGFASFILFTNIGGNRKAFEIINKDIFLAEFFITKISTLGLFVLLYTTTF